MTDEPETIALPVTLPTPTQMPEGWTIQRVAALVRDCSTNMYELPFILKTHGLSQAQYDRLAATEAFQNTLTSMTAEWNAIGNTKQRLALESALALEDALPTLAAHLGKTRDPTPAVIELAKLFAKMSGVGENAQQNAPTEKFKIVINLGADTVAFDKTKTIEIQSEPTENSTV
jgi:hypothetical protein